MLSKKKVLAVVLCSAVAMGAVAAKGAFSKPKEETITVMPETSTIQKGDISQRISATGTTVAADEHSIFIELSQEVDQVYAEVGDLVTEGQLLVTYDISDTKKELQDKLANARISLQNAQLALQDIAAPAEGAELLDLQSQVVTAEKNITDTNTEIKTLETKIKQAETAVANAKKTLENNQALLEVGGTSQKEVEDSSEAYDSAVDALEEAKQNKETKEQSVPTLELALQKAKANLETNTNKLQDSTTANSYKKQQNTVQSAQIEISSIQNELSKLTEATYSPITGTILVSNAVEGQMLTDSTVMMKVADLNNMDLEADVSEYDIAKVSVGQKVEMTSDGIEGVTYTGTVTKIEPSASEKSTTSGTETIVPIVVHMDTVDENVKPGLNFDMEIIVTDLQDVNYIPVSAVKKDKTGETSVFTVNEEGLLTQTPVTLGTYSDVYVQLLDGLTETQKFVTTVEDTMEDGQPLATFGRQQTVSSDGKEESGSMLDSVLPSGSGAPSGGGGMPPGGGGGGGMGGR